MRVSKLAEIHFLLFLNLCLPVTIACLKDKKSFPRKLKKITVFIDFHLPSGRVEILEDVFTYMGSQNGFNVVQLDNPYNHSEYEKGALFKTRGDSSFIINFIDFPKWKEQLKRYSRFFDIPILAIGNDVLHFDARKIVPIASSNYVELLSANIIMLNAIRDLFYTLEPKRMRIFYDNKHEFVLKAVDLLTLKQEAATKFMPLETNPEDIHSQIVDAASETPLMVILMCNVSFAEYYLNTAGDTVRERDIYWIVLTMDESDYSISRKNSSSLWIRTSYHEPLDEVNSFVTWRYNNRKDFHHVPDPMVAFYFDIAWSGLTYLNITAERQWSNTVSWKAGSDEKPIYLSDVLKMRNRLSAFGNYVEYTNDQLFQDIAFSIYWRESSAKHRRIQMIGNWSITGGIHMFYSSGFRKPKANHYRIQPPYVETYTDENGELKLRGYSIDILDQAQKQMNFTYELYEAKYRDVTFIERGRWSGFMGDIIRGDADACFNAIRVSELRIQYVDFTLPHADPSGMVMVRKRIESMDPLYEIITILELPVWLGIIATLFFTTFLIWIFHCCSPYSGRNDQKDVKCKQFTVMESFWFTIDCLLPQGPEETPKNMSGRIVGVTWWLFGFLVIASYTANLAAYLKVSHGGHIPNIESLAEQSRIKYAVVKGSAAEAYFERMSDIEEKARNSWKYVPGDSSMSPLERLKATTFDLQISNTYTNLWQSMQETGLPRNLTDGIERVLQSDSKEKFIFIDHSDVLEYFALTDCRLEVIGKRFFRGSYGIAVQADSGLSEIFNKLIIKMQDQKVLEILWNKWWNKNPNRLDCNRDDEAAAVEKFGKFFELIIICTSVLAFVLLLEFIYFKLKLIKCGKVADVSSSVKKRHIIIMEQSVNRV